MARSNKSPESAVPARSSAPPLRVTTVERPASRNVVIASYLLITGGLLLVMWKDLLPGLLFVCIGFLATRALGRGIESLVRRALPARMGHPITSTLPGVLAAAVVVLAPIGLVALAFAEAREFVLNAPE